MHRLLVSLCLLLGSVSSALAVDEKELLPIDQAFVVSAQADSADRITLSWRIEPGYYLYRERMSAKPVEAGIPAQALELPEGAHKNDPFFGDVQTFRGEVSGSLRLDTPQIDREIEVELKYQGCADIGVCYPPHKKVLRVRMGSTASDPLIGTSSPTASTNAAFSAPVDDVLGSQDALPADQAFKVEALVVDGDELIVRLTPTQGYYLYRDKIAFSIEGSDRLRIGTPRWPESKPYQDAHFGDVQVYFDAAEIPLPLQREGGGKLGFILKVDYLGCKDEGICYPPMSKRFDLTLPETDTVTSAANIGEASSDGGGLLPALLLAFIGGLILNLMPCVLPVLSLKALGLAQSGESRHKARAHALWYTAGVLISFIAFGAVVLALREGGQALGWGFQLQQPMLVGVLVLLMMAIGLNLSGVFEFGGGLGNLGSGLASRSGAAGDFFTGVLAVVVASPCTAPFMANGLAYAFVAPAFNALLVFAALGLGLAAPFLLIGFVPALARWLPKPGAWMQTMKQWLALPMYLTAVWLLWVFTNQAGSDAAAVLLIGAVLLAMGLWWWQDSRLQRGAIARWSGVALILLALLSVPLATQRFSATANAKNAQTSADHVAYDAQELSRLRGEGRVVFVDMTADWCITCKVNEQAVLNTDSFRAELEKHDAVWMVGDYTNADPAITAFLQQHRAVGVPLYVMFPADGGPGVKLPQVLSHRIMREALAEAAR